MKNYQLRVKSIIVAPEGEPIFSEHATTIEIDDEAGGEFVVVAQRGAIRESGGIAINPDEWPSIRDAIESIVSECRK